MQPGNYKLAYFGRRANLNYKKYYLISVENKLMAIRGSGGEG